MRARRAPAALAVLAVIGALLVPGAAVAQVSTDVVPKPAGGPSDLDGVIPEEGGAPAAPGAGPVLAIGGDSTRLHVRFSDAAGPVLAGGRVEIDDAETERAILDAGARVERLFARNPVALSAARLEAEVRSGEGQPDLGRWFVVATASPETGTALQSALRASPVVEVVEAEPTLSTTQVPEEEARQGYLDAAPTGVNAEWAWSRPGGAGQNVRVIAIDSGFDTAHPDMDRASAPGVVIPHAAPWDPHHGLQVLGIIAADGDGEGLKGIAHAAALHTVTSGRTSADMANAIDLATAVTAPGDVITISQGICAVSGCGGAGVVLPLVYSASARDALRIAAAQGVITVVSAGNGGANLDSYDDRLGSDSPETIVVGAGNGTGSGCPNADGPPRGRVGTSNYGSRVDLQGWGSCVRTAATVDGDGSGFRWWGFTSAATPQVAGAAALLSSMAEAQGLPLSTGQIRGLLAATGSQQNFSGTRGGSIGPLPDVRAAFEGITDLPANDAFAAAVAVERIPFTATGDARLAGVEDGEPAVTCGSMSSSLWYRYTPAADVTVDITTEGSTFDTLVGLWRDDPDGLERVDCADDRTVNDPDAALTATLRGGVTYYLQVGGDDGSEGRIRLAIQPAGYRGVGCDIDADGHGDLLVGSPDEDLRGAPDAGRAVVVFGGTAGRTRTASVTQEWPGVAGLSEGGDRFGAALACGDFDGDGYDDVAVGSPREGHSKRRRAGSVRVVHGGPSGLTDRSTNLTQRTAGIANRPDRGDLFGSALVAGDFDGDGLDDLAIAAKGEDLAGQRDVGVVHVVYGSDGGLDGAGSVLIKPTDPAIPGGGQRGAKFGYALASGDFDGNGFDDLAVGTPLRDVGGVADAGRVVVVPGSAEGIVVGGAVELQRGAGGVPGAAGVEDRFGHALGAGDVDGDGFDELAVGAPGADVGGAVDAGLVVVFGGSVFGLDPAEATEVHQDVSGVRGVAQADDGFGSSLVVADLTGDRLDDLAVGAPGETVGEAVGAGAVHVFDATTGGLVFGPDQVLSQAQRRVPNRGESGDAFGHAVAAVDTDGDGRRDLVVGVAREDLRRVDDVGLVLVAPGGPNGIIKRRADDFSQRSLGSGRDESGDRFGTVVSGS